KPDRSASKRPATRISNENESSYSRQSPQCQRPSLLVHLPKNVIFPFGWRASSSCFSSVAVPGTFATTSMRWTLKVSLPFTRILIGSTWYTVCCSIVKNVFSTSTTSKSRYLTRTLPRPYELIENRSSRPNIPAEGARGAVNLEKPTCRRGQVQ